MVEDCRSILGVRPLRIFLEKGSKVVTVVIFYFDGTPSSNKSLESSAIGSVNLQSAAQHFSYTEVSFTDV
jgi:hypothetical protein